MDSSFNSTSRHPIPQEPDALLASDESGPSSPLREDRISPEDGAALFEFLPAAEIVPPKRIPHLGHLGLFVGVVFFGYACAAAAMLAGAHFHFDGVATLDQAANDARYILGAETVLYLVMLPLCLALFPLFWNKSFFAGIHWRGATALRLHWRLGAAALGCAGLAALEESLFKSPAHAPIEDMIRTPGAAWLMFGFGVTFAPFFEEICFRGFLLPSLATACDWVGERFTDKAPPPLDENGHPLWSLPAMAVAAIPTSLLFAGMHSAQQGYSLGPFLQVFAVSLILCAVRLGSRSLAASALVHAAYNFLLFSAMMIGTGGFRHFDNM